jgi:hypothetical protein
MAIETLPHRILFRPYLHAVWDDGIARMGGGLGVALGFLAAYFAFIAGHNIALLWLLALLSFVFAGYRVWVKEHRARELAESGLERPKLTGFFQEASANYYYDEFRRSGELAAIFEPKPILGMDIVIYVRIVNVNPTPTTLHNFTLMIESEGKGWVAEYPEEPEFREGNIWTPPDVIEKEKRMTNLIAYLNNPEKMATRGVGIDGYLAFRVLGFGVEPTTQSDKPSGESIDMNMTLFVEDSEGITHPIEDRWGRKPRPSQRLTA